MLNRLQTERPLQTERSLVRLRDCGIALGGGGVGETQEQRQSAVKKTLF